MARKLKIMVAHAHTIKNTFKKFFQKFNPTSVIRGQKADCSGFEVKTAETVSKREAGGAYSSFRTVLALLAQRFY